MERHFAVLIGFIVMSVVYSVLGKGKLNAVISVIAAVFVSFILYFYV